MLSAPFLPLASPSADPFLFVLLTPCKVPSASYTSFSTPLMLLPNPLPIPSATISPKFSAAPTAIFLFSLIVYRAFKIGWNCVLLNKVYESLVSMGIGIWLGIQAFFNMGVNMGLLPTKGLTLPLMSFGGSGIVVNCIGLAILLRIDWENRNLIRKSR